MAKTPNPDTFTKAELLKLVLELKVENERLRAELEILKRKQARQAAPFSRNQPKKPQAPRTQTRNWKLHLPNTFLA